MRLRNYQFIVFLSQFDINFVFSVFQLADIEFDFSVGPGRSKGNCFPIDFYENFQKRLKRKVATSTKKHCVARTYMKKHLELSEPVVSDNMLLRLVTVTG